MKKKVILVILLLSLGIPYYFYYLNKHNNSKIIKISGNIETTEIDLSFQIFGKIKNIFIDEGDKIKNGQTLAELDKQELSAQKEKIKDTLKVIISRFPDLKTKLKLQEETAANKILLAKSGLNETQYTLNELRSGFRPQEIKQIEAGFLQAETNLKKTKNDYKRGEELFKEGFISEQNLENLKTNYETFLYQYQQAKEKLSLFLEGTRKENLKKAQEKVIQSKLNLNLAQNQVLEAKIIKEQMNTLKAELKQTQNDLKLINLQIGYSKLKSPIDGIVLVKAKEIGEIVNPQSIVLTLGELKKLYFKAYINDTDLGKVKLGQKVKLSIDSYPHKAYYGLISFISQEAEFTPKNIQTKEDRVKLVYKIKVNLENPNFELKPGMIADGEIDLE